MASDPVTVTTLPDTLVASGGHSKGHLMEFHRTLRCVVLPPKWNKQVKG